MPTLPNVVLQGKAKWAKVYLPNTYGKWSVDLYLTPESLERFKQMKVMNHLKKDDDGYYVTLSRPTEKTFKAGQGKQGMAPPQVVDKNGAPTQVQIGNGSDIKVELEYYNWTDSYTKQKKHACRINKIKIMELVPFEREKDLEGEDLESDKRLDATDASLAF